MYPKRALPMAFGEIKKLRHATVVVTRLCVTRRVIFFFPSKFVFTRDKRRVVERGNVAARVTIIFFVVFFFFRALIIFFRITKTGSVHKYYIQCTRIIRATVLPLPPR